MSVKLEDYRYDAEKCIGCKGCVWVDHIYMPGVNYMTKCPSYSRYQFDAYAAYGREKIAVAVMDERLTYTPELLKVIYACNLCGACDAGCKRNLDLEPIMVLEGLRNKCVEDGAGPMPAHKKITEHILNSGNYYDASQEERNWVSNEVQSKENADTIYFTGCNASFQNQGIVKSTIKILDAAGTHYKVLGNDECCCGHPLIATGQVENGRKIVEQNLDLFKKSGIQRIITSCAECYKTLKVDYPKLLKKSTEDMEFNVLHITEFISPLLNEEKLKFNNKVELRAAYHDPCNLGRLSEPWIHWEGTRGKYGWFQPPKTLRRGTDGIYMQPREILKNIPSLNLVDPLRMRENTWCCGSGGGVREGFPDFAYWTATERIEEIKSLGVEALISCCPWCKDNFSWAVSENKEKLKVYDITEVISKAI